MPFDTAEGEHSEKVRHLEWEHLDRGFDAEWGSDSVGKSEEKKHKKKKRRTQRRGAVGGLRGISPTLAVNSTVLRKVSRCCSQGATSGPLAWGPVRGG